MKKQEQKKHIHAEGSDLSELENPEFTQQTEGPPENQEVSDTTTVFLNNSNDSVNQAEDAVMKVMMEFFSEEMLPLFGITQKATALVPTEEVHLELKKGYQDFNLEMEDGSIAHFEFQSKNGGTKDLRRFRAYEMNLSYLLQKPVTTYVLFSGKIKDPMTELNEGINRYKVNSIIMSQRNADDLLAELQAKVQKGDPLMREVLVVLPLLPVFGGESSQVERIQSAFEITMKADQIPKEDVQKIEAAIYAMATKFLSHKQLEQIKGGLKMTYLGQLLMEEGRKEERENTERERLRADKAEADARKAETNARKAEANARKAEAELRELKIRFGLE